MKKINAFMHSLNKGSFTKNVLMITGGTVFAQGLSVFLSPVITRLYTPEDYGVLTVYGAFLGMINLLGAFSYDSAIPIADDDEKAFNILTLCLSILLFATTALLILLFFAGDSLLEFFNAEQILDYKYFIPIGFFLTGLYTVMSQWAFRKKEFKSITITKYSQSITGNSIKITMGLFGINSIGLILGNIFSQSAGILTLIKPHITEFKKMIKEIKFQEIKRLSKRYINFPLFTAPGLFVLSASGQLPTLFMTFLYGANIVGLYGLARSITFLPMRIIGKSVQDVFYSEAASIGKSNPIKIKKLSNKLLKKLVLLGGVPMIILGLFGPVLFSFIFGEDWEIAGVFARLLSIESFFHFIFHPISTIFSIFEQQKTSFLLSIGKLLLVLSIFGIANVYNWGYYAIVFIFSVAMAVIELLKYVLAQKIIDEEISKVIGS
ncbi:lipopolysaccharide biosynthesis protein [Desemzia sp. FAM 23991]|uniref:lipopolysaccharide biosynthesis protein n=1 Tax=unclassified Desemzia TaxID=2685243 RepID=UPI00388AACCF